MASKSISRIFSRHGHFCVIHSWEITVVFIGIVGCLFSFTGAPKNYPAQWIMMNENMMSDMPAQIHIEKTYNCVTSRTTHSRCLPLSQMEDKKPIMETADVLVMTIIRSIALLYGYHQLKTLKRMGTRRVLGLTTVFAVFAGFAFSSAAHLLHEEIAELREALVYFLLILDLPKACLLAKIALHSSKTARSLPRSYNFKAHISEGIVLLGPSLTLDTFLELFVLTIGNLSGVRRLQILCSFASLSIIINYIVFMTVYPASLYIILELFKKRIQRRDRDSAYRANPSEKSIAAIQENIYQVHNTMLQRAKIGIAVALVIIHSYGWISVSLDQLVVFVLTAVLAVRYFFFEDKLDTDNRNPLQVSQQQPSSLPNPTLVKEPDTTTTIVSSSSSSCNKEKETPVQIVLPTTATAIVHPPVTMSTILSQQPLNLSLSNKIHSMDNNIEKNSSACSFRIGESDSDSENSENDDTKGNNKLIVADSCNKSIQTLEISNEKEIILTNNTSSKIVRSIQDCLAIYKSEDGAKGLSDEEVIALVNTKHIPAYQLEKAVDDAERGVAIRRKIVGKTVGVSSEGLSNELPYKNYDYSKVMGACCENVIGYIPVPVGVAGPLKLDGTVYQVPMATTEGCLVASTNRGCRALQNGIRSRVVHDGMSRAPIVRFPNAIRASEAMLWLTDEDKFQTIKSSFDSSSRFARLQKVHCRIAGRYLFIRFVAKTGDAMGMNMISKGTEVALNTMQENFSDMEIMSLSGNVCTDKKPAAINWIEGRGKSVVAEAVVPAHIVENVLKTTVAALVELNIAKNLVGSAMAGSIGGFNAHAANIVTAIYIATGQDPAQNVGSSNCMTLMEPWGDNGKDLFISCSMPSIEIGTVGGGTILGAQSACLEMLGVKGANSSNPGENARTLARIVCGTVLAGELSLMSALAAGHLVRSHLKHNRSSTNVEANPAAIKNEMPSSLKEVVPSEIPVCNNKPMQRLVGLTKRPPLANSSLTPQSVTMDFLSLPECKQA